MSAPAVNFASDTLSIHFDRFGIEAYRLFLRAKRLPEYKLTFDDKNDSYTVSAPARFASLLGVDRPDGGAKALPLATCLFDDQAAIVQQALDAKRFAVWSDCGLGKTLIGLEFARQVTHRTGGRALIVSLNDIVPQWLEEAVKFYGDELKLLRLKSRDDMRHWCQHGDDAGHLIAITNYEKWNPESLADQVVNEARYLAAVILDESSRLKAGGGKQKWAIIKSCRGVEYKLSLTATPAPNETTEFASQASFLEKMRTDADIIWTYFVRDSKTHRWTVKPHARKAFFEFMSSWSIYVRSPKRYGWRLNLPEVPKPILLRHDLPATTEQLDASRVVMQDAQPGETGSLIATKEPNAIQALQLSQIAKGFRYHKSKPTAGVRSFDAIPSAKPAKVVELVRAEVQCGAQVLLWTVFDAESRLLAELLTAAGDVEFAVLVGSTPDKQRRKTLERFRHGDVRCLIARPSMLGWGMNFQFCSAMIFSGFSHSFEQYYQAVRRAVRHGQQEPVRIHVPLVTELEGEMWATILRKEAEFEASIVEMEENYIRATGRIQGGQAA